MNRTEQHVQGYRVARKYQLGRKPDAWAIALDFASHVLADSGVVGFGEVLSRLTPDNVLAIAAPLRE